MPYDLTGTGSWTGTTWTWVPGAFSGIPAIFLKPSVNVKFTPAQFPVVSGGQSGYETTNGAGLTIAKYVYVVNGYLVEVTKTVSPVTGLPGQYDITITVYNKGNKDAPDVIVYDIVQDTFTMNSGSASPAFTGSTAVANVQGITGMAYWRDVGTVAATAGYKTITYRITAVDPNAYPLTDVYLVGVDPAQSLDLRSTPFLNEADTVANVNNEALAAVGVIGLYSWSACSASSEGYYKRKGPSLLSAPGRLERQRQDR